MPEQPRKLLMFANTSWHIVNFRLPLIRALQSHNIEVVVAAPMDEFTPTIKNHGVRYIPIVVGRKTLNPLRDLLLTMRLLYMYRREKPDIVFHNTIKPVIYGSLAAHWAGVKSIVNMIPGLGYVFTGDNGSQQVLRYLVRVMYRVALARSHAVIFQNPDDSDYFRDHNLVDVDKSKVIPGSGVDLIYFPYVEPDMKKSGCMFLFLGRLLWDKGVAEFVEAGKRIRGTLPATRVVLLGIIDKDNPSHIPESVIRAWADSGDVEYIGSAHDVRGVLRDADVVVLPSYYREGVPRSLLEAAAMGKPVITTNMPGCREALRNNETGLLVEPKDVDGLTSAMRLLALDPQRRAQMGRAARKFAAERFDVNQVNREILNIMGITHAEVSSGELPTHVQEN